MKLTFDPGTVTAPTTVTIALADRKAMADFSPSGTVFKKPVHLDADITGLNFTGLSASAKLALYYLSGSSVEKMSVDNLTWMQRQGPCSAAAESFRTFPSTVSDLRSN